MLPSLALALALTPRADALEGMWRPSQLPELSAELKDLAGDEVDPTLLADLTAGPLAATVALSKCSGAFVSETGLVATSYHCITGGLQFASQQGENLFEDGFHARTRGEERWLGPSEYVRLTLSTEDVTDGVLAGTKRLTGTARHEKIQANSRKILSQCEADGEHLCEITPYDHGVDYELRRMKELRDVRLVYAPPRSVGYFGGNDDNWSWPRHSGDFAFLRAYADNNHPAQFSASNGAYTPTAFIKPAMKGPEPGEFAMVTGYPAYTFRWLTAAELDLAEQVEYPVRLANARQIIEVLDRLSAAEPDIAVKVGSRKLSVNNNITYWSGVLEGLEKNQLAAQRWQLEKELEQWVAADPDRTRTWGASITDLRRAQAALQENARAKILMEDTLKQTSLLNAAVTLYTLAEEGRKPDKQRAAGYQNRDLPQIEASLDEADATFDWRVDRDVLRVYLDGMMDLPECSISSEVIRWIEGRTDGPNKADRVEQILDQLYKDVDLADPLVRRSLMQTSPWFLTKSGNPWFELAAVIQPGLSGLQERRGALEAERDAARAGYMEALRAFYPEARPRVVGQDAIVTPGLFYSDANDTLRFSFGKVDGYIPNDGLIAEPVTRLEGIAQKSGPYPFDAPASLLAAMKAHRYGSYASERLHSVPVNYLTTLDTARGSSGSPTINAKGEFIGIIFDGNDQSMAADWVFDAAVTRSIHTDVSYILWYLDAVAGAGQLLQELGKEPEFTAESFEIEPVQTTDAEATAD
ncbi:MAG: S46 family peptidase [Deltaproteobacteria bacterium]|nr:S46 family peptidase [Deltaproteobacteria bacterium]